MKAWIATLTILLFISTSPLLAQERMLKGQVLLVGENGETTPATGVDITFNETGDTTRSKTSGLFKIFLPDIFKSGETLTLQVKKQGWRIQYPLDGEARIPANLLKETVIIRLLPVGSKQFWTEDRIKKYIENVAEKSKEQVTQNGKPEDIDLNRYIKEWATQYGFSAKQAKQQIDNWISEVEKKDDYEERGLAAHAKKKFGKAGKLLSRAAKDRADEIKSLNDKTASAMREAVKLSRLAGDAYYNNYNFEAALAEYEQALLYIDKNESPQLWASVYINIGNTNNNIGIRTSGKSIHQFLSAAVAAYRLALEVYTREAVPQGWATTQNNLANALRDQAARTAGNAGAKLLGEAVAAYRLALEVRTREALPQDWAQTQNNLANALIGQAARTAGNAGAKLLSEAVAAYRLALEVRTREALPQNWATTQNNLANALRDQAARTAGNARAKLLSEAVAAFRLALEVRTREALPKDWAATQSNLAAALSNQAVRTSGKPGIKLMNEAVTAYHLALEVYTREALPQNWAMTQNNLGKAYLSLKDWKNASTAFTNVLEIYSNHYETLNTLAFLYHEKLFQFNKALEIYEQMLKLKPNNLNVKTRLAEKYFTTKQFMKSQKSIEKLLPHSQITATLSIPLLAINIANKVALGKTDTTHLEFTRIQKILSAQPKSFKITWTFSGIKQSIQLNSKLASQQKKLIALFNALEGEDRDAILRLLEKVKADFFKT